MSNLKNAVKNIIPPSLLDWRRRKIAAANQQKFADKTAAETFSAIYERNAWGGAAGEFYSGDGSTNKYADVYAKTIKKFIAGNKIERVVDLGCGDFRVAAKFVSDDFYYIGCDVVPSLIEYLNEKYKSETIEFRCVNIAEDDLPDGDLCLIRQVLQHLSNAEIEKVLRSAGKYKFLIITEHYPNPQKDFEPNLDIPHGPSVRVQFDSAVVLDAPPFNLKNIKILLDVEAEEGTRIKTFVITNV
ncbi:MAG: class I SAM-dependent methyltransferase [Pyrinomonadaceae bacterium]